MVIIFPDSGGAEITIGGPKKPEKKIEATPSFPETMDTMDKGVPLIDVHEPEIMKSLLGPVGFSQYHLNSDGWADYYWEGLLFKRHVERKTWAELSSLDKVEEQIHRHLTKQPDAQLTWLLEGVATPSDHGYQTYKETHSKGRTLFVPTAGGRRPMKMVHAWLYGIGKFVEVHYTSSLYGTANLLTSMYQADQKEHHSTLHRYYKKVDWHPNPQVSKLIAIADGLGEKRAEALIERFGTIWNVLKESPAMLSTVNGIGMNTAKKILRKAGRPDV